MWSKSSTKMPSGNSGWCDAPGEGLTRWERGNREQGGSTANGNTKISGHIKFYDDTDRLTRFRRLQSADPNIQLRQGS